MELGLCMRDIAANDLADVGRFAEDHGFSEIYVPDAARGRLITPDGLLTGRDAFCGLAAMFAATSTVRGALGVAAAPMHQPLPLAMLASTLQEMSAGRFSLGIGASHPELTARHGVDFPTSPLTFVRERLDELRGLSQGGVAFGGGWPVLLAALGPKMVQLGAEHSDGLVLNWLTPASTATTIDSVVASAPATAAPRTVLYLRVMPDEAAHRDAENYTALANYHRHFVAQGLRTTEAIVAGTTLPLGDVGAARDRIAEYRETGLDLLCLYPYDLDPQKRNSVLAALRD